MLKGVIYKKNYKIYQSEKNKICFQTELSKMLNSSQKSIKINKVYIFFL